MSKFAQAPRKSDPNERTDSAGPKTADSGSLRAQKLMKSTEPVPFFDQITGRKGPPTGTQPGAEEQQRAKSNTELGNKRDTAPSLGSRSKKKRQRDTALSLESRSKKGHTITARPGEGECTRNPIENADQDKEGHCRQRAVTTGKDSAEKLLPATGAGVIEGGRTLEALHEWITADLLSYDSPRHQARPGLQRVVQRALTAVPEQTAGYKARWAEWRKAVEMMWKLQDGAGMRRHEQEGIRRGLKTRKWLGATDFSGLPPNLGTSTPETGAETAS
eukprot:1290297-Rhodomonas_salina.1